MAYQAQHVPTQTIMPSHTYQKTEPVIVDSIKPTAVTPYHPTPYVPSHVMPPSRHLNYVTNDDILIQHQTPMQEPAKKIGSIPDDMNLLELVAIPFWLAGEIGKVLFSRKPKQSPPTAEPDTIPLPQEIPVSVIETPQVIMPMLPSPSDSTPTRLRAPELKMRS